MRDRGTRVVDGTTEPVWYLRQNWNRQVSIEAAATSLRFAVIGAGRLGTSLALALRHLGHDLVGFTAGSPVGRQRAAGWLGMPPSALSALVSRRPELYFVCVPDGLVAEVASELGEELVRQAPAPTAPRCAAGCGDVASLSEGGPVVAHTSGATSVSVLRPCEEAGAAALVFHPLQTFPDPVAGSTRFAGAGVAITPGEGNADIAGTMGMRLADALRMRPFLLADDKRGLYHAAASVACNYLVTLESVANELFVKAGLPERLTLSLFLPLVQTTLENLAASGPMQALTGPLSRGDSGTIETHLAALAKDAPAALPLYRTLGTATLDLVAARGDVDISVIDHLRELLRDE